MKNLLIIITLLIFFQLNDFVINGKSEVVENYTAEYVENFFVELTIDVNLLKTEVQAMRVVESSTSALNFHSPTSSKQLKVRSRSSRNRDVSELNKTENYIDETETTNPANSLQYELPFYSALHNISSSNDWDIDDMLSNDSENDEEVNKNNNDVLIANNTLAVSNEQFKYDLVDDENNNSSSNIAGTFLPNLTVSVNNNLEDFINGHQIYNTFNKINVTISENQANITKELTDNKPQFIECINACGHDHDCIRNSCLIQSTYFG